MNRSQSESRTYTTKHGTTATMKTEKIIADRPKRAVEGATNQLRENSRKRPQMNALMSVIAPNIAVPRVTATWTRQIHSSLVVPAAILDWCSWRRRASS